jgi:hypothetical protein
LPYSNYLRAGIGWIKRKAFAIGTVTLTFKHYTDKDGVEHFDIDNHLTGGIPGTQERRPVDGVERERSDMHFGLQLFYTKRRAPNDVEGLSEFLKGNWTKDTLENGLLETDVKSDTARSRTSWLERHVSAILWGALAWTRADQRDTQVWGIEEVQGERRFTRHIEFEGPKGQRLDTIMYFDYLGA